MALPNFLKLYTQLDLQPDCSLDDFKYAYRRRIAELHPDRSEAIPERSEDESLLSDLNSTYAAAIRFHKQHGRLPGSKPEPTHSIPDGFVKQAAPAPEMDARPQFRPAPGMSRQERLAVLTALALALVSLFLLMEYL